MHKFYIADIEGRGLHYVQGNLYWGIPCTFEAVTGFTLFNSAYAARQFAHKNEINFSVIAKVTLSLG